MAAVALVLLGADAGAVLPGTAADLYSDGGPEYAVIAPGGDGVSVYDTPTGHQVGRRVVFPTDPANDNLPDVWTVAGTDGSDVYLSGNAQTIPNPGPVPGESETYQERLGVADTKTGAFTLLCAYPQVANVSSCPIVSDIAEMGSHWLVYYDEVLNVYDQPVYLAHWSFGHGVFHETAVRNAASFGSAVAKDLLPNAEGVAVSTPLDLNTVRVSIDPHFDYRVGYRTYAVPKGDHLLGYPVIRSGDRRVGVINLDGIWAEDAESQRGLCLDDAGVLTVWDQDTRVVWRHSFPHTAPAATNRTVMCSQNTVIASTPTGLHAYPWPTSAAPAGWERLGVLEPGTSITVPGPSYHPTRRG